MHAFITGCRPQRRRWRHLQGGVQKARGYAMPLVGLVAIRIPRCCVQSARPTAAALSAITSMQLIEGAADLQVEIIYQRPSPCAVASFLLLFSFMIVGGLLEIGWIGAQGSKA